MHCRICRSKTNLKYSCQEDGQKERNHSIDVDDSTAGNICWECEDRLLNFDKHSDEELDGDSDHPVIVDDDELLYNLFFNRRTKKRGKFTGPGLRSENDVDIKLWPEVIDVLTSRECTPERDTTNSFVTIDLESLDGDVEHEERLLTKPSEENFESIEVLSSDSEESINDVENKADGLDKTTYITQKLVDQTFVCTICNREFSTRNGLKYHLRSHDAVNCPKCCLTFTCSLKLVQHIRTLHRTYSGDILSERPKYCHDSAMTIRLKYRSRHSYYECNLCGQIDFKYPDHRQHILSKHSEESRRLKDPVIPEIKCPICQEDCETNIQLCRHLRTKHPMNEGNYFQFADQVKISGFCWKKQDIIEQTSLVLQLKGRNNRYYECKLCGNIGAGYFNHWRHLRTHGYEGGKKKKHLEAIKSLNLTKQLKHSSDLKGKKLRMLSEKCSSKLNGKKLRLVLERCSSDVLNRMKKNKNKQKTCEIKKNPRNNCLKTTMNNIKKKSPRIKIVNQPQSAKVALPAELDKQIGEVTSQIAQKTEKTFKKIHNQTYTCNHCLLSFVGYNRLNLHFIRSHAHYDFYECKECLRNFSSREALDFHGKSVHSGRNLCEQCTQTFTSSEKLQTHKRFSHRRKNKVYTGKEENLAAKFEHTSDENINPQSISMNLDNEAKSSCSWLIELLQHSEGQILSVKNHISATTYQCLYCTRLCSTSSGLRMHEQTHTRNGDFKLVVRRDLN